MVYELALAARLYMYSINLETIVEYDIKSKYLEEDATINKVGSLINGEKLFARKSCFM